MKTAVIVQARLGSMRLPGKVLLSLAGKTVVEQVLARARVPGADEVVAAIPAGETALAEAVRRVPGVTLFEGHPTDVLDRYYQAAKSVHADTIVRLTADCPLTDPEVSGRVLRALIEHKAAYASNNNPPTFPHGLDVEAFTFAALEAAWKEATLPRDREHVTYFLTDRPERFKVVNVPNHEDLHDLRITLDTPADYALLSSLFDRLGGEARWRDAVGLLRCP